MSSVSNSAPSRIELFFYKSLGGNEPVREWLVQLPEQSRRAVGMDLQRVQFRFPVGMSLVRPMGHGLFEVRTNLPDRTMARILFCFHDGALYALNGFIKKSQKTPEAELELARKRQKEIENA
jgi:phage-related protein